MIDIIPALLMTLAAGTLLGPYEILGPLGAGGMGEVFRGRDTRLNRTVAIKTLAAGIAMDAESRRRFDTEARAVSALNHPHICALYDVGRERPRSAAVTDDAAVPAAEIDFLVLELLSGDLLSQRLERGALPFDQLCQIAIEIGGALDAAHAQGITHRDLKPSNVMITKSGAKLLDFGLAKLQQPRIDQQSQATRSIAAAETSKGAVLGTFQYMAPEQVEGKDVDARTDIFSFGALLYEMAAGRPAFSGNSQASLTASILAREPVPPSSVTTHLPAAFDHLVGRCLAKDPEDRWQSARDVLFELRWIREQGLATGPAAPRRVGVTLAWSVAAVATVVAAGAGVAVYRQSGAVPELVRLQLPLPPDVRLPPREIWTSLAISPNGRHVAFTPIAKGTTQLWVHSLDEAMARPLPGTEGATRPFWSPESESIGFVTRSGVLKRVPLAGGAVQVVSKAQIETLPSWGSRGSILYSELAGPDRSGIFLVRADGGEPRQITRLDASRQEREHYWPSFLPDGERFFYVAATPIPGRSDLAHTVFVASVNGGEPRRVADIDSRIFYAPTGHVVYAREASVLAQRFDLASLALVGDPIPIVDRVNYYRSTGLLEASVSATGVMAVREGGQRSELVWLDRNGSHLGTLGAGAPYGNLRISPDGRRIAVAISEPATNASNVHLFDRETGIPTRFTFRGSAVEPMWSADGETVFFRAGGPPDLFQKPSNGRGEEQTVKALPEVQTPLDASSDGNYLAYTQASRSTDLDLWLLPLTGDRTPKLYIGTAAAEMAARFSPDSQWIAFVSTESGASEVYVAPVDDAGARYRISAAGGLAPRWAPDGRHLFYLTPDRTLVEVPLTLGRHIQRGSPRILFKAPLFYESAGNWGNAVYELAPDGRFLVNRVVHDVSTSPITVLINWPARLAR